MKRAPLPPPHSSQARFVGPLIPAQIAAATETPLAPSPSHRDVEQRAYYRYVSQGSNHGQDQQHWLEAESELIAERSQSSTRGVRL